KPGAHEVFVLAKRANQQALAFNFDAANKSLRGTLPANTYNWQRVKLDGLLDLPAGESTVTLRIAAADGKADFSAEVHAIELVRPDVREALTQRALAMRADPTWFQNARYGMMVHWTKQSVPLQGDQKSYEQAVAEFDVEKFADTMQSTGAGFVVFTTSHAFQYFPGPNKALDAILPGRTTQRDLPADLSAALEKRGMKLFLYLHLFSLLP
ncbi:MAG: alpha-L-fucosidase, partial [Akkermansiaceae bacterium]|nr:alpha-L-fucosidase [Akkermansiaceae bacterium]